MARSSEQSHMGSGDLVIRCESGTGDEQQQVCRWVAESQGRRVGSVTMTLDQPRVAWLRALRLCSAWRGKGIAAQLVEAAVRHAREQGCLKLILEAETVVHRATELLTYLGFQYAGEKRLGENAAPQYYIDLYGRPRPHPPITGLISPHERS